MAVRKAKIEQCDNPDCDYEEVVGDDGKMTMGYHFGKGYYVLAGGGPIPAFYAHRKECIIPALDAVIAWNS